MDVYVEFLILGILSHIEVVYPGCPSSTGVNIAFNKTATQNHAYYGNFEEYGPNHGNDGDIWNMIRTGLADESFWRVDLQGYYVALDITLVSTNDSGIWNDHLRNAYIGVSVLDTTSPGSDVIICGQWPNETLTSATRTFSCNLSHPVRFVKVWKGNRGHLGFSEVEVTGIKSGMEFVLEESKKVTTITNSHTVSIAAECASICFNTGLCIAFSFRQGGQHNCLLATQTSASSGTDWVTYILKDC